MASFTRAHNRLSKAVEATSVEYRDHGLAQDVKPGYISGVERESHSRSGDPGPEEATLAAQDYYEDKGVTIELVDGEQFAKLIVERGFDFEHESCST